METSIENFLVKKNDVCVNRKSLNKINTTNSFSITKGDIKEIIEFNNGKQKFISKKLFVYNETSRFNNSNIEILCMGKY